MRMKNKTVIVTGGASGFGEGMIRRFAEEGANTVIADINDAAICDGHSDIVCPAIWHQSGFGVQRFHPGLTGLSSCDAPADRPAAPL